MTRINIEIDEEVHRKVKVASAIKGLTLIEFINNAIAERIKKERLR
jgi:predicted HicB family RNase H-like nuclease